MTACKRQRQRFAALVGITQLLLVACEQTPTEPASATNSAGISAATSGGASVASSVGVAPTHEYGRTSAIASAPVSAPLPNVGESASNASPLRVAYSRDPGFVEWESVAKSGAFTRRHLTVQLTAYDHASSLEAFSAGRADAVAASNADVLVGRSLGSPCTVVAVTSVHVGGETLFARRDVKSVADLRGKTIGVELGQPEHLALEHALEAAELTTAEVRLVNIVPEVAHREFASRSLHAVMVPGAAAKTLPKRLPSVRELETARSPSLVYGVLCVRPGSLAARRGEWTQVVRAWEDAAANPSRSSSGNASTRLVATPDPQLREALMTATEVFDAFHVRTRAYPEAVFHAFSSNDIAWL